MNDTIETLARRVGDALLRHRSMLAAAESCTGGWVAKSITDIAGSSAWFERGFVTYTNEAKREMLGVAEETLSGFGAVSEATVREMAAGALAHSRADLSLAVSGIAGPGGGTEQKPVGMVCFAWARRGEAPRAVTERFTGDREAVRGQAVIRALLGVLETLGDE